MLPKPLILLFATYMMVRLMAIGFPPNWGWHEKLPIIIGGLIAFGCWCWVVYDVVFGL